MIAKGIAIIVVSSILLAILKLVIPGAESMLIRASKWSFTGGDKNAVLLLLWCLHFLKYSGYGVIVVGSLLLYKGMQQKNGA
jgi:hypothetical protein